MEGRFGLAALGALLMGAAPASAQTAPLQETAEAVSAEMAVCSAFFEAGLTCFINTMDLASINTYQAGKSLADAYGVLLGKRAGLSGREVAIRFERAKRDFGSIIGQSCDGFATVSNQYATACTTLVQDPNRRFYGRTGGGLGGGVTGGLTQGQSLDQ